MKPIDSHLKSIEDYSEVDQLIACDKIILDVKKNITTEQSILIFQKVKEFTTKKQVNWEKVVLCFESTEGEDKLLKKIQRHYYNKRAIPHRKRMKKIQYQKSKIFELIKSNYSKQLLN